MNDLFGCLRGVEISPKLLQSSGIESEQIEERISFEKLSPEEGKN